MSKLSINYTLSDGRVIEIPAADLRSLRDDLNELLPPGHDRYEQPPMPFVTTSPPALYTTMTPSVPPDPTQPQPEEPSA